MKNFIFLIIGMVLIGGSVYLFLQKAPPDKYATLVSKPPETVEDDPIEILFVGDIMLDRSIRNRINENGFDYILEEVKSIFENKDLIVGNLEGTITENKSISVVNNKVLRFTFSTTTIKDLMRFGFSGFSLANNHALDFYDVGYEETKENLSKENIFSFGSPLNNMNLSISVKIKDENVCFVGYHSLYNASTTTVINEIKNIKPTCNYLVVFAHWGEEYKDYENTHQQEQGRGFIDAGADLIIGSHPHVIQPVEIYKSKAIFYSLGNFIFDQDFSLKTRQGIAVNLGLEKNLVRFSIIPIETLKGRLYFPTEESFKPRIAILSLLLPPDMMESININKRFTLDR